MLPIYHSLQKNDIFILKKYLTFGLYEIWQKFSSAQANNFKIVLKLAHGRMEIVRFNICLQYFDSLFI